MTAVATVWLFLLRRAGEPAVYADVAKALPALQHRERATSLNVGARLGYLVREGQPRAYSYRVTPNCTVPPSVPIKDVLEAVA